MNHKHIVGCICKVGCSADVAFAQKCFCFPRMTDKMNVNFQRLCHCGEPLGNSGLHLIFVHIAKLNIQCHQIIDNRHRSTVLLNPIVNCADNDFPISAEVIVVDGKLACQHSIQLRLNAGLQAEMIGIQRIRHYIVRARCLKQ